MADPGRSALQALVELLHPAPIAVVLVAATGFCAVAARGRPPVRRLGPLLVAISLTQLAISIHNDYCDRGLDAVTKPWRMIPRGALSPRAALAAARLVPADLRRRARGASTVEDPHHRGRPR